MRKSIATVSLSGSLEEKLVAAAQVGFDGVELFESDLISCPLAPAEVRRRADRLGLRIELYQPLRDIEAVPEPVFERNLRRAEAKFAVMNELEVETLVVCSNVSPATRDDDALAVAQLRRLADAAARHGVRLAYEALAWGRLVNTLSHAWKIVEAADHPNLGLCLDSFHVLSRREDPAAIRDIPADKIAFVQLCDAPEMSLDILQWSRHYRCFPGQGSFDLPTFVGHVLAAGYRGPLSLEVFNDVFRQADAERTATDALRSLIALEDAVSMLQPRPPGDLSTVEKEVELTGYSFVEISVDAFTEIASQHVLTALGFQQVGQHRSKPVQMWRQGDARILLNRTRPAREDWPRGDAAVSAFAVEGDDPSRSARRAQAMLAPAMPRRYGPGEADLFATETPDGTSVFFCRTDADDPGSWVADFEPVDPDGAGPGLIRAVDHIGLSQPAYYVDEAVLFYQAVLGLRRTHSEEVADPYGLMRSRAMGSRGGGVRLLLNVPAIGGGKRPETADFQHVALSCTDIFTLARHLRQIRLPVLPIPGNYYTDLSARTSLTDERIDAMRELSICYDSDESGGEYYHFWTAMVGRRLFFEIVQRVNGYDGYATTDTPVRMAAQYRHTILAGLTG